MNNIRLHVTMHAWKAQVQDCTYEGLLKGTHGRSGASGIGMDMRLYTQGALGVGLTQVSTLKEDVSRRLITNVKSTKR